MQNAYMQENYESCVSVGMIFLGSKIILYKVHLKEYFIDLKKNYKIL